tara:strand:+ start:1351 stop:1464 length:114 start_codon:yes stop_codon:yes gene_type:complete
MQKEYTKPKGIQSDNGIIINLNNMVRRIKRRNADEEE